MHSNAQSQNRPAPVDRMFRLEGLWGTREEDLLPFQVHSRAHCVLRGEGRPIIAALFAIAVLLAVVSMVAIAVKLPPGTTSQQASGPSNHSELPLSYTHRCYCLHPAPA